MRLRNLAVQPRDFGPDFSSLFPWPNGYGDQFEAFLAQVDSIQDFLGGELRPHQMEKLSRKSAAEQELHGSTEPVKQKAPEPEAQTGTEHGRSTTEPGVRTGTEPVKTTEVGEPRKTLDIPSLEESPLVATQAKGRGGPH